MPCGEHTCPKPCHPLLCGSCEVAALVRCYCGHEMKEMKCCDKEVPRESAWLHDFSDGEGDDDYTDYGYYECNKACDRLVDLTRLHIYMLTADPPDCLPVVSTDAKRGVIPRTERMECAYWTHELLPTVLVAKRRSAICSLNPGRTVKQPSQLAPKSAERPSRAVTRV